jgi:MFS family permease
MDAPAMRHLRAIVLVMLPFSAAYFTSYFFRTINALISQNLVLDLKLGAAHLGLLTSAYFLAFAVVQIPAGLLLDRYGPRRVQSVLLLVAALGAFLFAIARGFELLLLGRALIGLGVAASLVAGLKAIDLWFPRERLALVNGCFIMIGTLGVVSATLPAEWLLLFIGWKTLFGALAVICAGIAALIFLIVPEATSIRSAPKRRPAQFTKIYTDVRFWRLAPLSMMCISTAWALQGLWAAPWFADVDRLDQQSVVSRLFVMAVSLSLAAVLLGVIVDRLCHRGVRSQTILASTAILFVGVQIALILHLPVPWPVVWSVIAGMGAATVISYTIIAEYFPKEISGQANAALNTLHIGGAFVIQTTIGMIVNLWASKGGHYPAIAYEVAVGVNLALQILALGWFLLPVDFRYRQMAPGVVRRADIRTSP